MQEERDFVLFYSLAIGTIFVLLYFLLSNYKSKKNNVKLPRGKFGWPVIGETLDFYLSNKRGHPEKFVVDRMKNYSSEVFKTSLIGEKIAVLCGPSGNKLIFSNENKLVKSWIPQSMQKMLCIPESNTKLRNNLSEFLKPEALKKYIHVMDYNVRQHLDHDWAPNQTLKVFPLAKKFTFSLICRLFLGIEDPTQMAKLDDQFAHVTPGFLSLPINIPGTAFSNAIKACKSIRRELRKIIRQQRLYLSEKEKDSETTNHFLSHILFATDDDNKFTSEDEIACILLIFLIAGHDTTTSLITNLVYYLADNPHVYAQVLREENEIAELKGPEKMLTWEDINGMKYARNVVNEVLRLAPPAQGFFREAIQDITYAGFTIPKGWKVYWSVSTTHKDPKYFPSPEKFDPTRFEGNGPEPYTFIPFGGGPRMCPGSEFARQLLLVFMYHLVRKYSWEKLIPNEKINFDYGPAAPVHGLPIKLHPHSDIKQ